jgi:hypothetical protein
MSTLVGLSRPCVMISLIIKLTIINLTVDYWGKRCAMLRPVTRTRLWTGSRAAGIFLRVQAQSGMGAYTRVNLTLAPRASTYCARVSQGLVGVIPRTRSPR